MGTGTEPPVLSGVSQRLDILRQEQVCVYRGAWAKMRSYIRLAAGVGLSSFCLLNTVCCVGGAAVDIPEGVRYKKASRDVNEKARKRLADLFRAPLKPQIPDDAFARMPICGPFLWSKIKHLPEMKALKKGRVVVSMPIYERGKLVRRQEMQGKMFQDKAEIREFWKAICKIIGRDERFRIRWPTKDELKIYWALIPYDIGEPIFVLESDRHTLLVDFVDGQDQMFWIDDLRGVEFLSLRKTGVAK